MKNDKYLGRNLFDFGTLPDDIGHTDIDEEGSSDPLVEVSPAAIKEQEIGESGSKLMRSFTGDDSNLFPEVPTKSKIWPSVDLYDLKNQGYSADVALYLFSLRSTIPENIDCDDPANPSRGEKSVFFNFVEGYQELANNITSNFTLNEAIELVRDYSKQIYFRKNSSGRRALDARGYSAVSIGLLGAKMQDHIFNMKTVAMRKQFHEATWENLLEPEKAFDSDYIMKRINKKVMKNNSDRSAPVEEWSKVTIRLEDMVETFGLKQIKVNKEPTHSAVRSLWLALDDLAKATGLDRKAIGIDQKLKIKFDGADAKMGYNTESNTITVPHSDENGSLAYDWYLAIDHQIGKKLYGGDNNTIRFVSDIDKQAIVHALGVEKENGFNSTPHGGRIDTYLSLASISSLIRYGGNEDVQDRRTIGVTLDKIDQRDHNTINERLSMVNAIENSIAMFLKRQGNSRNTAAFYEKKIDKMRKSYGERQFMKDARELDAQSPRTQRYYSTKRIMTAKAFESFVNDALHSQGIINDYLIARGKTAPDLYRAEGIASPYPQGKERQIFNDLYSGVFDHIKQGGALTITTDWLQEKREEADLDTPKPKPSVSTKFGGPSPG